MLLGFCFGWISALVFVWLVVNKFDASGKFASLLLGDKGNSNTQFSHPFDEHIQQLSALIRDNTELLQTLREVPILDKRSSIKPRNDPQFVAAPELEVFPKPDHSPSKIEVESSRVNARKKKSRMSVPVTEVHNEGNLFLQAKKKGGISWKKYHFVLTTTQLSIFQQQGDDQKIAHIKLGFSVVQRENYKFSFSIASTDNRPIISIDSKDNASGLDAKTEKCILRSKDEKEIQSWINSTSRCVKLSTRLIRENEEGNKSESSDDFDDEENEFDDEEEENEFDDDDEDEDEEDGEDISDIKKPIDPAPKADILDAAKNSHEKSALRQMITELGNGYDPHKHDSHLLLRFLRARQLDPSKAIVMLQAREEWESTFHPNEINAQQVKPEAIKKKCYFHCHDKEDRPCTVVLVGRHQPKDSDLTTMLKLVVFMLETAIAAMPPGVEKFCTIFDCSNFSINQMDWPLVKEAIAVLQNFYPERLGALYIVNYPMVISMLWKMIKPWLDQRTSDKIQFIDTKRVKQFFDPKLLPKRFGGTSTFEETEYELGLETLAPDYIPPQVK